MGDFLVKDSGSWVEPGDRYVKQSGSWVQAQEQWMKNSGFWYKVYPKVEPTDISTCTMWFDADDLNSNSDGSNITLWTNKVGNGANFDAGAGLTLRKDLPQFAGNSALQMVWGNNDKLIMQSEANILDNMEFTVFLVAQGDSPDYENNLLQFMRANYQNNAGNAIGTWGIFGRTNWSGHSRGPTGNYLGLPVPDQVRINTPTIMAVRFDRSIDERASVINTEGSIASNTTQSLINAYTIGNLRLGESANGGGSCGGYIAEIVGYDRPLTDNEVNDVMLYLSNKHMIPYIPIV
jgi:hypothetical protein